MIKASKNLRNILTLKKLLKIKVTSIPIIVEALKIIPKNVEKKKRETKNPKKHSNCPDHNTALVLGLWQSS